MIYWLILWGAFHVAGLIYLGWEIYQAHEVDRAAASLRSEHDNGTGVGAEREIPAQSYRTDR